MYEYIIALVPILPWFAALWIAANKLLHGNYDLAREKKITNLSLQAHSIALFVMLYLDLVAIFHGVATTSYIGEWFHSGNTVFQISFMLDKLSLSLGTLFLLLTILHIRFSVNYIHREPGFDRFFIILNLFSGAMLLIVLSGNPLMAFAGWELAGICSFLLVGFVVERPTSIQNATRIFITNRIGDCGFILGIVLSFMWFGNIDWNSINQVTTLSSMKVGLIALSFSIAAFVKSAQIPFAPWILRALEGPTPSGAVFYGALMVHAGVYLLLRLEPLISHVPVVMAVLAMVGLCTAIYAWLSGLVQSDAKGSIMLSVTAQVGLMFFWCGLGWFQIAAWHLALHACWRAYQFLHAPSLLHIVGHMPRSVPLWLVNNKWVFNAAIQRFWLEQIGDSMLTHPAKRLARDAQIFEEKVVNPMVGLPTQTNAVSSMMQWEELQSGTINLPEGGIGSAHGAAGKLMENLASALHWFEKSLVLKGGGEGLFKFLQRLGKYLIKVEHLLSQPCYLLLIICILLIIII